MIKQAPVKWEDVAQFVASVGRENVISIIPLQYDYSDDALITHHGQKSESVGMAIVSKYLIVYDY